MDVLLHRTLRAVDESDDITRSRVDVDVAGQLAALVTNHRGTGRQREVREMAERLLLAHRRLDQDALEIGQRLPGTRLIADVHRIPFSAFDRPSHVLSADR